jgi:soluble lytic murein transglycosylase-like protein
MKSAVILLFAATVCTAGEYAVLSSGLRMRVDRHESADGKVRLFTGAGTIELAASDVVEFQQEDYADLSAPAPQLAAAAPASQPAPSPREIVAQAADKYGLPRELLHHVASAESGYRPDAVSPKGAIGLMQLMPGTAAELQADPHDPVQNADAGARYLRDLLLKYDGSAAKALAAYNAGPGAVDRYKGVPPYRETQRYVAKIIRKLQE